VVGTGVIVEVSLVEVGAAVGAVTGGEAGGGDVPEIVGDAADSPATVCDVQPDTRIVRQRMKTIPTVTLPFVRQMPAMRD
jgi:hypothetical protein